MMSLSTIRSLAQEQAERAAHEGLEPHVIFSEETALDDVRSSPSVGDFVAEGWEPAPAAFAEDAPHSHAIFEGEGDEPSVWLFVDSSGFGDEREPALTLRQLDRVLRHLLAKAREAGVTLGTAIVQEGQFQLHIGCFVKSA